MLAGVRKPQLNLRFADVESFAFVPIRQNPQQTCGYACG
jgi:hypothetical protein